MRYGSFRLLVMVHSAAEISYILLYFVSFCGKLKNELEKIGKFSIYMYGTNAWKKT